MRNILPVRRIVGEWSRFLSRFGVNFVFLS